MASQIAASAETAPQETFHERRIVGRALSSWEGLRTGESFPLHRECLASFDPRILPGMILIEINRREEDDIIVDCGPDFIEALGRDPIGLPVHTILPSSTDRGLVFWRVAAELKKPIADVGGFTNANGIDIVYRSVFLPVSEDGTQVTHLLGAFSYRMVH